MQQPSQWETIENAEQVSTIDGESVGCTSSPHSNKTARDFHMLVSTYGSDVAADGSFKGALLLNGHVLYFHSQDDNKKTTTKSALKIISAIEAQLGITYINVDKIRRRIHRVIRWAISIRKNIHRYWPKLVAGMEEPFDIRDISVAPQSRQKLNEVDPQQVSTHSEPTLVTAPSDRNHQPSKKLRKDCYRCAQSRASVKDLTAKVNRLKSEIRILKKKKVTPIHHLNQNIKRKTLVISKLRSNLRWYKDRCKSADSIISRLHRDYLTLRDSTSDELQRNLRKRICKLKCKRRKYKEKMERLIKNLQDENGELRQKLKELGTSSDNL